MSGSYPCAFGKYILLKPLAQGGMGELYLALTGDVGGFEKLCVLKRVRATRQSQSASRRFVDEAKVVLKLSHGNLVQVFDVGLVNDQLYMAMEYVEGRDLHDILFQCDERKLRIPTEVALYIGLQVCRGLDYVHGFGDLQLVHRDICPSNVLVSFSGEVKVTDFGLAQSTLKEEHTAPGKVFGRFAYMAPEQTRRADVDQRTDVYATAIIVWELLVGKQMRPGPHADVVMAMSEVRSGKVVPPSTRNPRIAAELDAIVVKGLQVDPERRYANAEEMRRALAKALVRLNPTFDTTGLHDFMRQVYGSKIEEARQDREQLLRRDYDRWRSHSTSPPGPRPSGVLSPRPPGTSGRRPGEAEDLSGQVVDGRYRIVRPLGEGGMGAVYEAEHVEIGRRVALKILHAIFSSHPETVARFRAEARAATRIGHPNIVEVTDSGTTDDGRVYFVMELLVGVDLARVMADDRIVPACRATDITLQLCRALDAAHGAGIIHRDLKPENIFLTHRDGQEDFVKILDFGIAKNVELGRGDDRLTHPGIAMGTPEYMAPEQAAGKDVDHRIDVYATGALLYEMLTGHLPHEGENLMQVLSKKASQQPPPPRGYRAEMPEALEQILLKAMAAAPVDRYQTMAELAEALLPFAGEGACWDKASRPMVSGARGRSALATGPSAPRAASAATGPGMPGGFDPTLLSSTTQGAGAGGVRLSDEVMSEPQVRISLAPASAPRGQGGQRAKGLAATVALPTLLPALRRRSRTIGIAAGTAVVLLGTLAAVFWPRGDGKPVVTAPARPDSRAASSVRRPDARVVAPATLPASRPRPSLSDEQVQGLLEWTKRAADGGRYLKPKGDNVIELLDRIEEAYPEHPAAQQLRRDLSGRLSLGVKRALQRQRLAEAERLVQAWMALDPLSQDTRKPFLEVQLAQGRQALSKSRLKAAQQHASAAAKIAPQSAAAAELLGDIAARRRKWTLAVKHYEDALEAKDLGKAQRKRLAAKLKLVKKKVR